MQNLQMQPNPGQSITFLNPKNCMVCQIMVTKSQRGKPICGNCTKTYNEIWKNILGDIFNNMKNLCQNCINAENFIQLGCSEIYQHFVKSVQCKKELKNKKYCPKRCKFCKFKMVLLKLDYIPKSKNLKDNTDVNELKMLFKHDEKIIVKLQNLIMANGTVSSPPKPMNHPIFSHDSPPEPQALQMPPSNPVENASFMEVPMTSTYDVGNQYPISVMCKVRK